MGDDYSGLENIAPWDYWR